jgi:DNA primase
MREWLENSLYDLTEDQETYLLGRGVLREEIRNVNFQSWCPEKPCPAKTTEGQDFVKRFGEYGHRLNDLLLTPLYSPSSKLVGVEGRSIDGNKTIMRVLSFESKWCPIWIGLGKAEMLRIWNGYDVWIVEGIFDLTTLRAIMPHVVVLGSLRANLTKKHLEFLSRFVKGTIYVAYDNDETGQKAMYGHFDPNGRRQQGIIEKINKLRLNAVPVRYKGGKDPNEIWQQGGYDQVRKSFINYL